jgi:hypothetical protein
VNYTEEGDNYVKIGDIWFRSAEIGRGNCEFFKISINDFKSRWPFPPPPAYRMP